jgi:hypothetical protein
LAAAPASPKGYSVLQNHPLVTLLFASDQRSALTSASDIIKVIHITHSESVFEGLDRSVVAGGEDLIEMCYHGLKICRAILGHILSDGVEIPPIVALGGNAST